MGKVKQVVVHEAKLVALVSAYFISCFGFIALLKTLMLAEYQIQVASAGGAVIGALVMAKVVIVLDKTSLGDRFARHSVWLCVLYKSLVYTLFAALVLAAEKLFEAYRTGESGSGALTEALDAADPDRALATTLCVLASFLGYNLLAEIGRDVGWDRGRAWLFSRRQAQDLSATPSAD